MDVLKDSFPIFHAKQAIDSRVVKEHLTEALSTKIGVYAWWDDNSALSAIS